MNSLKKLFWNRQSNGNVRKQIKSSKSVADSLPKNPSSVLISRLIFAFIGFLILWGTCSVNIIYRKPAATYSDFVVGQKVRTDLYAKIDFSYEDETETSIRRQHAANKVLDIYRIDDAINDVTHQYFTELLSLVESPITNNDAEAAKLRQFSEKVIDVYKRSTQNERNSLIALFDSTDKKNYFLYELDKFIDEGVASPTIIEQYTPAHYISILDGHLRKKTMRISQIRTPSLTASDLIKTYFARFRANNHSALGNISENILTELIRPNLIFDDVLTNDERRKAGDDIQAAKRRVIEGTVLVQKGKLITAKDLKKLEVHNQTLSSSVDSSLNFIKAVSLVLISLLSIVIGMIFFYHQDPLIWRKKTNILLVTITIATNILLIRSVEEIFILFPNIPRLFTYPALPLAFSSILLTLLLGNKIGLSVGVFSALLAALSVFESMHIFILGLFASCTGAVAICTARTRVQTFRAALMIALSIFLVESIYLFVNSTPLANYLYVFGVALVNGFLILILANLLLPIAEHIFGISTNISLLELSDLNHPLLKRLQMEAPGTYHHTLMVATLSEHAADAIGANTLLTRVSTYFHDIGKLSNPSYFTENSYGVDRHEDLSPRMSSMIILNHVKEGLAMATKYKLKQPIRDVIASHHGTSLIYFFYHRAKTDSQNNNGEVDDEDFRYPGPLPRSKEASIISLADSCEAASRSLQKPTPKKIQTMVSEIFRNKILDRQLNESELNMAEINLVEETIIKTLTTMLHSRISYPKLPTNDYNPEQSAKKVPSDRRKKDDPVNPARSDTERTEKASTAG